MTLVFFLVFLFNYSIEPQFKSNAWFPLVIFHNFYYYFLPVSSYFSGHCGIFFLKWKGTNKFVTFLVIQVLIHNPTWPSRPSYILCIPVKRWKWQKHQETLVYPLGVPSLRFGPWPLGLSLTKRVIMSVWHTKQQILWHSAPLFSIPFSSSHSRFVQRQCRVSGSAIVSAVRDWSQIKVG